MASKREHLEATPLRSEGDREAQQKQVWAGTQDRMEMRNKDISLLVDLVCVAGMAWLMWKLLTA